MPFLLAVASTGIDLADDPAQRKLLHVVLREDGLIGAYPNNRLTFLDRALYGDLTAERIELTTLSREFRAEGLEHHRDRGKANGNALEAQGCSGQDPQGSLAGREAAVGEDRQCGARQDG
jgi:hypothetical protein